MKGKEWRRKKMEASNRERKELEEAGMYQRPASQSPHLTNHDRHLMRRRGRELEQERKRQGTPKEELIT